MRSRQDIILRATASYQQCIYVITPFECNCNSSLWQTDGGKNGKHNKGNRQGEVCADVRGFLAFKMPPAASHKER